LLHVHRAERSDRLVAALAEVLAEPLDDPLVTEVISVHSRGIERWIAQELSARLGVGPLGGDGVAANLEFPFPGRLIRDAIARGSGIDPDHDPWLPERLTWPLLALVDDDPDAPMLGPLRAHVGGDPDPEHDDRLARRFGAVRHVADLFDRYGVHRPDMLVRWRDSADVGPHGGALPDRHRWQPALWRAVHDRLGIPSFAERRHDAIGNLTDDASLLDLPPRLALFGLTSLPATYLEVLTAIAAHRDVHLMLLHPSPVLWERVAASTAAATVPTLPLRDHDATAPLPRNPLLRSWGRDARELQLIAPQPDPARHHHHPVTDAAGPRTLLERIQADVRADRAPGTDATPPLDPADRSLQVHDCHGRLRQVEVVRDAVLHLLADTPGLEPRDIIVMCPDIEHFAPLVTAVFGADAVTSDSNGAPHAAPDGPPALRVRLADRSLRRTNALLEVVSQLLELVDGRVTASAVLDLITREPVRRRFRFDDDEVEVLESWVTDLQIRWGLDGDHRKQHGLPPLEQNTWKAGLERLQLGIAMADEQLRLVAGVAPFDDVEGKSSDLAGRLVELVTRLGTALDALTPPRTIAGWRDAIGAATDALTAVDAAHDWQRLQLHRVLDGLVEEATVDDATSPVEVTLPEARVLLSERLAGRPSITSHRTGDLTISTLVPMRSVPHRVVVLMGLDDGAFPRQAVPDSDDLLQLAPRVGDRDPRSEDRQLLLDALLAATETLVITYAGRDERTNESRPPAVPVDELLDVVDRAVTSPDDRPARAHVTTAHPLAEHDARNFEPRRYHPHAPWGFHPATLAAARAQRATPAPPRPFLAAPLPEDGEGVIDLDDLVAFLEHPVKAFVRQRLDVTLTRTGDEPSDAIPASLKGLDAWKVGDALLEHWLAGDDPDRSLEVLRARGVLPPEAVATSDLDDIRTCIDRIVLLCGKRGIAPGQRRTVDVEVELPDGRVLSGSVPDVAAAQPRVQTISYSRVAPKHRLAAWARFLAVTAQHPDQRWEAVTVGRYGGWKRGLVAQANGFGAAPGDVQDVRAYVTTQLGRLVDLYDRGMRAPLPLYCETSAKIAENLRTEKDGADFVDRKWETPDWAGGFDREDRDPYHQLVLGGQIPTEALFEAICDDPAEAGWAGDDRRIVAYAWRLWQPLLDVEWEAAA
jgi:exodeoxyribonuclease V gamma subunit